MKSALFYLFYLVIQTNYFLNFIKHWYFCLKDTIQVEKAIIEIIINFLKKKNFNYLTLY